MHDFLTQARSLLEFAPLTMAIAMAAAALFPNWWPAWLRPVERRLSAIASRRWTAVFVVGAVALLVRLIVLPAIPIPRPISHDESAYVFGAQTFAAGHLANPSPPAPEFFESPQIFVTPTYSSGYQPGQSLVLALGIWLTGHPWWGVWLSFGLFCATVCWALQGWVPLGWAFFGGLVAVIQPGVFYYWVNGYWSGLLPATGGALVIGAVGRLLRRRASWIHGVPLGVGIVTLEMTRIFEGQILIFCAALLLLTEFRGRPALRRAVMTALPAVALILIGGAISQAVYNVGVTGDIAKVPYVHHTNIYFKGIPLFVFAKPAYHPANPFWDVEKISTNELAHYYEMHTWQGIAERAREVSTTLLEFGGIPMFVALATVPWVWRRARKTRAIALIAVVMTACLFIATPYHPHYSSPGIIAAYVLFIDGMRRIRLWTFRHKPAGFFAVRYAAAAALLCVVPATAVAARWTYRYARGYAPGCCMAEMTDKDTVAASLAVTPGKHIVFVRFEPSHNEHSSWIYNEPDLQNTRIIWARDLGDRRNAQLMSYYRGRRFWKLDADRKPLQLEAVYDVGALQTDVSQSSVHSIPESTRSRHIQNKANRPE